MKKQEEKELRKKELNKKQQNKKEPESCGCGEECQCGEDGKKCEDLEKEIEELKKQCAEAKEAADKEKGDYLRLMAEFETFRRRTSEDRLNLVASAASETIKGLLPVLDDCERAMEMLQASSDEAAK